MGRLRRWNSRAGKTCRGNSLFEKMNLKRAQNVPFPRPGQFGGRGAELGEGLLSARRKRPSELQPRADCCPLLLFQWIKNYLVEANDYSFIAPQVLQFSGRRAAGSRGGWARASAPRPAPQASRAPRSQRRRARKGRRPGRRGCRCRLRFRASASAGAWPVGGWDSRRAAPRDQVRGRDAGKKAFDSISPEAIFASQRRKAAAPGPLSIVRPRETTSGAPPTASLP